LTRKGELSRLNLRGRYFKDSIFRAVNTSGVDDPEQPPTPGSVDEGFGDDVNRQRIDIRPSFTYALTERWQMGLGYQFLRTFYDNPNSIPDNRKLADFDRHTINGRVSVPITEKNKLVSILSVSRFNSEKRFEGDQERTTDNYQLQAGLRHDFDETMSFTLTAGGRYTVFDVSGVNGVQKDRTSDTGYVARLNAFKKTGLTTFDVNLEHNLSPSGVGDQVLNDELNFKIVRKLTEFISVSLFTRIFQNESIGSKKSASNRRSLRVDPSLSWTLAEAWSLVATYRYQRQKDFGEPDPAEGNSAFLTLVYQPPSELGK
jgi:lipopolysaccharide assembly outer membrane protein LptD (OstA)